MEEVSKKLVFGDRRNVTEKMERIGRAGKNRLHAVLDFDRTLTPGKNEKGREVATWKLLNRRLPADTAVVVDALYKKYRPLEVSGKMTAAEAIEWWSAVLDLYGGRKLKWSDLAIEVEETIPIRPGVRDLFAVCGVKAVPTIIISAGLRDVIELWCQKFEIFPTKILSTNLHFDDDGYVCGWERESLIHNFNKRERGHEEISALRRLRPNTILVGDNIEDAAMVDGDEGVLRVFVDDARDDDLRSDEFYGRVFKKFDIAVRGGSLEPLVEILRMID